MVIIENAVVQAIAGWIWGSQASDLSNSNPPVDSLPQLCLSSLIFMPQICWSMLVTKLIGVAIILASCLNKAPVIANIQNSKSAAGISRASTYGEILVFANASAYGILEHHPATAYGENIALLAQNIIVVILLWRYAEPNTKPSVVEQGLVLVITILYGVAVVTLLSPSQHYLLQTSILPVLLYARGSQIYATALVQHTGAQSIVTTILNLAGGIVRVLTTIQEVGYDLNILTGYGLSIILNLIIFIQFPLYSANTSKFRATLQEQNKKKQE
jgi:mannose-P-dolichol utilization defect 1